MSPDDIRQEIELKVVEYLKARLALGKISEERSQHISKVVLETLKPGMNLTNLYKAIPKLDDTCPELSPIILPYLKEYEDNVAKKIETNVTQLIRQGQYDAASKLVQQAVDKDIDLVWTGKAGK